MKTARSGGPFNGPGPSNDNWLSVRLGEDSPFSSPVAVPTYSFAAILAAGGGTGLSIGQIQYGANPPYTIVIGICPVSAYVASPIYNATTKFVQWEFNSAANGVSGVGYVNLLDLTGTGVAGNSAIVHDSYLMQWNATAWGTQRYNSGVANSSIFSPVGALAQGDVVRLGLDFSVNGQTTVITSRNGTVVSTVVDNNANRLKGPGCFPIITNISNGNGFAHDGNNFDCGVGL